MKKVALSADVRPKLFIITGSLLMKIRVKKREIFMFHSISLRREVAQLSTWTMVVKKKFTHLVGPPKPHGPPCVAGSAGAVVTPLTMHLTPR